ncbi:formyltransferase family protein [Flavobacterium sp. DG2-3]|uniref:formyltransferase family protein n=1 Tax=Flavobacterium sp. DG2-3 TaxID=3068317 RepID=UPI00273F65B2|nr:formyltransferase family protein [Flavobacterium sp. DG2-3]MDP5200721.1 formyltransferase family protein [Flavobacterium sp. DG2-3]
MKIIYIGSVIFSAKALDKLITIGAEIVGIVSKKESSFNSDFFDLKPIADNNKIPFHYTLNINSVETIDWIKKLNPDVIFCFGWSNLIKKDVLNIAHLGVVGYHPTLLPNNKGRHPLIWAKVLGLQKSGSTFFFMDEGADTGDILSQSEFKINFEDDAATLYTRLIDTALLQIEDFHFKLKNNTFLRIPQNKYEGNNWRKRSGKDGLIDFRLNTTTICNLVRGLTRPYVGAHVEYRNENIIIWEVEVGNTKNDFDNLEPGKVLNIDGNKIEIKTGDSSIWLVKHEFNDLPQIGSYIL